MRTGERVGAVLEMLAAGEERARRIDALTAAGAEAAEERLQAVETMLAAAWARNAELEEQTARLVGDMERAIAAAGTAAEQVAPLSEIFAKAGGEVRATVAGLGEGRAAIEGTLASLQPRLAEARSVLHEVQAETDRAALAASTKLIDALTRVRDVSQSAAGTMRAALDDVIDEAHVALGRASEDAARRAFSDPLSAEMDRIADAADRGVSAVKAASDQLSRQLFALSELSAQLEARVAGVDERLRDKGEADMPARASELIGRLGRAAIPIAQQLGTDVSDSVWKAYQRGDQSIFARRTVRLISRSQARQLEALAREDDSFRAAVANYVGEFETLMKLVGSARGGEALGTTLLSSDVGKLYVALAGATGRLPG